MLQLSKSMMKKELPHVKNTDLFMYMDTKQFCKLFFKENPRKKA